MADVREGEVGQEDGGVVGSEEEGGEGTFGVLGDGGFLEVYGGVEGGRDLLGGDGAAWREERVRHGGSSIHEVGYLVVRVENDI